MELKTKLTYISYLRIMAMIMVVYYHCICCYTPIWAYDNIRQVQMFSVLGKFLNNIHIPLFFAISGYLYGYFIRIGKYQDNMMFIKNKAKRLLVPFIPWSIFAWAVLSSINYIVFVINGASYVWFLGTLFVLFLIVTLLKKYVVFRSIKSDISISCLVLLISFLTLYIPTNPGLILYEAIAYFYIFWGGVVISKYDETLLSIISPLKMTLLLIVSLTALLTTCMYSFKGSIHLMKAFSMSSVCLAILCAQKIKWPQLTNIAFVLDNNSMGIYLIHYLPIHILLKSSNISEFMTSCPFVAHILLFIFILSVSTIISEILRRNRILKFIIG